MVRKVTYRLVYEIEMASTGLSTNRNVLQVESPEEAGAAVVEALGRMRSWEWVTVRERELRMNDV